MARMIGRTGSWLWWLAGCACALAFGPRARGADFAPRPKYGVEPMPAPVVPEVGEAERRQAEELIDEHLRPVPAAEPSADEKTPIGELVKGLGAGDFAARDAASSALVKIGQKALGPLREAAKSSDPEVVQRAGQAVAAIETQVRAGVVNKLKRIPAAARAVIGGRSTAAGMALRRAVAAEEEARKAGDAEAEKRAVAERASATALLATLRALQAQVSPLLPGGGGGVQPLYGVMIQGRAD